MSKTTKELDIETLHYVYKGLSEHEDISVILKYGDSIRSKYIYHMTKCVGPKLTEVLVEKYGDTFVMLSVISVVLCNISKVKGYKSSQSIDFSTMLIKDTLTCDQIFSIGKFLEVNGDIKDISSEHQANHILIMSLCLERNIDYKPITNPNLDYTVVKDYLVSHPTHNIFFKLNKKMKALWNKRRKLMK